MSYNQSLELALPYADRAGCIALARQESARADRWFMLLCAVLEKTGPVEIGLERIRAGGTVHVGEALDLTRQVHVAASFPTAASPLSHDVPTGADVAR